MQSKIFDTIPCERPKTPLLDQIDSPSDVRQLKEEQLPALAEQLREFLLYSVGQTGGHFGAGLGVVELTVALHYILNTPDDHIVWDVGHQSYPHKILTQRRDRMSSIRQLNGLAGFPKRNESKYDTFGVGHSSTSISAALGMALADKQNDQNHQSVAVIGDGAMTAGMAFEALNHAAHTNTNMLVVLNDNSMSISKNVGGLATYFSKIWASKTYSTLRKGGKRVLKKIPPAWEFARKTEEHIKGFVSPGALFEELGFYYVGPIHGHNVEELVHYLRNMLDMKGPKLLHIITEKGHGFAPAIDDPVGYHALNKIEPKKDCPEPSQEQESSTNPEKTTESSASMSMSSGGPASAAVPKYQDVFGQWLCDLAKEDQRLTAITPAMCEGSGMNQFADMFPDRYHDVAIAEQHAVTVAAGMACEETKPVVAIYSTFLQRAYDQLIHDVALQNLDVTFAIDRAGLVGEDGPSHAGSFDISFLRCIPNMIVAAPSNENECRQLLFSAYKHAGPSAVRYPRGKGSGVEIQEEDLDYEIGKGRKVLTSKSDDKKICVLNFGVLMDRAEKLAQTHMFSLCDMRWIKPLDESLILEQAAKHDAFICIEENTVAGGAGSAVSEFLAAQGLFIPCLHIGLPDKNIDQGTREEVLDLADLSYEKIEARVIQWLQHVPIST